MAEIKTINVKAYLQTAGEALVDALGKALPETADATGALRKSIKFTIKPYGLAYHFELTLKDYYEWVDQGRKAGKMPPVSNIIKWIADKKFVMKNNKLARKTAGGKLKKVSDNLSLTTKLAWAIAKKISKTGTKGTHFYSNTVPDWIENLKRELPKAYGRDILISVKEGL
jgi:hypothetical protein